MNINVASIANAIVIKLYFHLNTCQKVANSGTGLKKLCRCCCSEDTEVEKINLIYTRVCVNHCMD